MTLYVLGAGSIGLLYASHMRKLSNKYPIVLLLRNKNRDKLIRYREDVKEYFVARTMLKDKDENSHILDIPSEIIGENTDKNVRSILLTTKAFQAVAALQSILPRIDTSVPTNLILMTNGCLGVSTAIQQVLAKHKIQTVNIVHASCTHGAKPLDNYHYNLDVDANFNVIHTGVGKTFLEDSTISDELYEIWNSCGLHCSILSPTEMYIMNWKKLAANCVINPLTALRKCTNGELIEDLTKDEFHINDLQSVVLYKDSKIACGILKEVSNVALAQARNHPNITQDNLDSLKFEHLRSFVMEVMCDTARNKSSMLLDVLNHRETEIDYLNGYIVNVGIDCNIDVKANQYISSEIRKYGPI